MKLLITQFSSPIRCENFNCRAVAKHLAGGQGVCHPLRRTHLSADSGVEVIGSDLRTLFSDSHLLLGEKYRLRVFERG
jgi:hypothetical protein